MGVRIRTTPPRHGNQPGLAGPLAAAALMAVLLVLLFLGLSGLLPHGSSETVVQVSVSAIAAATLTWFLVIESEW
jgi:hypothetical protein